MSKTSSSFQDRSSHRVGRRARLSGRLLALLMIIVLSAAGLVGGRATSLAASETSEADLSAPITLPINTTFTTSNDHFHDLAAGDQDAGGNFDVGFGYLAGGQMSYPTTLLTTTIYLPIVFKAPAGLQDLITQVTLTLPHPLAASTSSWCTWGGCTLPPRLYHEPLPDDRTLLGWTDSSGDGHVSVISGTTIQRTFDYPARSLRGMVAHSDGSFAVLLWDGASQVMWLSRRDADGGQVWATNINTTIALADFWLGDSRLAYGDGQYAAYFTVKGVEGQWPAGHYGDQLTYVDEDGANLGGRDWGCSHSMAQLLSYHPDLAKMAAICSSDCYASKGILIHDNYRVYTADGNCGGLASAQLGGITPAANTWKLVFSALDRPCCDGRGIGLATVNGSYQGSYTWLTNTDGAYERDPSIARLGTTRSSDRYLVGWRTTNNGAYWLGVIDGAGIFLDGPDAVSSAGVAWGDRDDSFRTRADGSVSWVQGNANSRTVRLFRFDGSTYLGP